MIVFSGTDTAFSSTIFETFIDNWSVTPAVTVSTATDIPVTTFANVVNSVGWHVQGTNTLTGFVSTFFTSTTVTVFVQTATMGGISSFVIDPTTGGILSMDNFNRSGTGFELGSSNISTATSQDALGWIVNRNYVQYLAVRDLATTTISTTIWQRSISAYTASQQPTVQIPAFNTQTGAVSTSTYSI
jgi:hypothetical protein